MPTNKNKQIELTVQETAEALAVSTRTVINYIKAKEIDAIKVGKAWYIKKASFDAFQKKYSFPSKSDNTSPPP